MSAKRQIRRLILVFDADTGRLSALVDSARKLFRVNGCALCSITHGLASEKDTWKDCREELGVPVDYRHRDELFGPLKELTSDQLPCVVAETSDGIELLMTSDVLERCGGSVDDFKGRLLIHAAMRDLEMPIAARALPG